jgi:hypothetical protein
VSGSIAAVPRASSVSLSATSRAVRVCSTFRGVTDAGVSGPSTSSTSRRSVRPPAAQPMPSIEETPTGSSSSAPVSRRTASTLFESTSPSPRRARKSLAIPNTSSFGSAVPAPRSSRSAMNTPSSSSSSHRSSNTAASWTGSGRPSYIAIRSPWRAK